MATSSVAIDEGTADKRAATYSLSEDAVTKELQRVVINTSGGVETTWNANSRAAAANSAPVVLSNEDLTEVTAIKTAVQLIDNAISGTEMQVDVVAALPAGTNTIGKVNILPETSGGFATPFRSLDLDETEEEVKATAGQLYKLRISNFATTVRYVKLYNDTAANVVVGTTAPIDTIPVPPASAAGNPTVITENYGGHGLPFTALCLAATTGLADADTGAPAANDVVVSVYFK